MRQVIKKEPQQVSPYLVCLRSAAIILLLAVPAASKGDEPNTPTEKDQNYVFQKYEIKKDASGEPVKDASGDFIFVPVYEKEPNEAAFAVPIGEPQVMPTTFKTKLQKESVYIGPEVYSYKYREPGVMKNEGIFYGLHFGVTARDWVSASSSDGGLMFRAEGRFAFGRVDYDGALSDGTPYKIDGINDLVLEGRLLLGADVLIQDVLATLYSGAGYRYLNDDTSFDPAGYERQSNYLYIPLGGEIYAGFIADWYWGAGIEFDYLAWGMQESDLSDFDPTLPDVHNRQNSGYGYRASVRFEHKSKDAAFAIEPFYRYWDIDKSEVRYGSVYEPANDTREIGVQLYWMF
jgi:hypothetical protein